MPPPRRASPSANRWNTDSPSPSPSPSTTPSVSMSSSGSDSDWDETPANNSASPSTSRQPIITAPKVKPADVPRDGERKIVLDDE